jgi:DNA-binding XRE family transcriptional regulator
MKKQSVRGRSFDAHMKGLDRRNPEFRKASERALAQLPVSTQLAIARREAGLTQDQVARRLRVSQSAVAQVERADGNPTVETVAKIARLLGYQLHISPVS